MARDYKYRAHGARKNKTGGGWLWLLTGYLLGAFTVGLLWLKLERPPEDSGPWIGDRPAARGSGSEESAPTPPKPRFDFYTLLPEMEVVVPAEELEDLPESPPPSDRQPAAATGFVLQVGSFRNAGDADRLKARLALLGLETRVHRVAGRDGKSWYRVRCGPYRSAERLREVRRRLAGEGLNALVIRQPGAG